MSAGRRSKLTFFATIALFGAVAFLAWRGDQRVYENKGRLAVAEEGSDAVVLSWASEIAVPMARRLSEAFDEWKTRKSVIVIDLDSPGGSLAEGRAAIEVIQKMRRTHLVVTRVGADSFCLSMCVPIYLQGERRVAGASSTWMFHEPTTRDFYTDEEVKKPKFEQRADSDRFFVRYFESSEMDPVWRAALEAEWRGRDVWKTGQDLTDEGSGIVTVLE